MTRVKCNRCDKITDYKPNQYIWDYNGLGYNTKFVVCPECGKINILKYEELNLDLNNDERWYEL